MKDYLSKNRDFKMNWSGFDVFMEYWVDLGINIWKNGRKTHILGIFGGPVLVHLGPVPVQPSRTEPVPVQVWNRCGTPCFILTSVRILAITCLFLIRFE